MVRLEGRHVELAMKSDHVCQGNLILPEEEQGIKYACENLHVVLLSRKRSHRDYAAHVGKQQESN